jgi:hypothetical protein
MLVGLMVPGALTEGGVPRDLRIHLGDPPWAPTEVSFALRAGIDEPLQGLVWVQIARLAAGIKAQQGPGVDLTVEGHDVEGRPRTLSFRSGAEPSRWRVGFHGAGPAGSDVEVQVDGARLAQALAALVPSADG